MVPANGVIRPWYVSFQTSERRLAPVDAHAAAGLVYVFLDRGLGQAELRGDLLVGQEGGEPQTFFLAGAEALRHSTLRLDPDSYGLRTASSSATAPRRHH